MGNTFGQFFRVTTWGESHGPGLGMVIDGCPPGLSLSEDLLQKALDRRRPGQSALASSRQEPDRVQLLSGVFEGLTLGTPIACLMVNQDARSEDYRSLQALYRPGHADYPYQARYGHRDWRGGGRASARETVARVAAGAVAAQLLRERCGVEVLGWVSQVGPVKCDLEAGQVSAEAVEASPVRCPEAGVAQAMAGLIAQVKSEGDSIGGVVSVVARGVPAGWGAPVFAKLEAQLGAALLSIPAARGVELGDGFACATLRGSQMNDAYQWEAGRPQVRSNHAGGVLGGISTGAPILLRVAFRPPASIAVEQQTVTQQGEAVSVSVTGRHDPCIVPRAVPVVEAMVWLVLADQYLSWLSLGRGDAAKPEGSLR